MVFFQQLKQDLQLLLVVFIVFGAIIFVISNLIGYNVLSFMSAWGFIGWGSGALTGFVIMTLLIMGFALYHNNFATE